MSKNQAITKRVPLRTSEHVAFVIGPQGSNIKQIQKKTGTAIKSPARNEDPVFIVTGDDKAKVKEAANDIRAAANRYDEQQKQTGSNNQAKGKTITKLVRVPKESIGRIIGKGGKKLNKIRSDTDTDIIMPSGASEPVFIITGQESDVIAAEKEILYISNNIPPLQQQDTLPSSEPAKNAPADRHATAPPPSSKPSVGQFLGQLFGALLSSVVDEPSSEMKLPAQRESFERRVTAETIEVTVAKKALPLIIGRQASTIKGVVERTGTSIRTPNRNEAPTFVISGSKEGVEAARRQIQNLAEKAGRNPKQSQDDSSDSSEDSEDDETPQQRNRKKKPPQSAAKSQPTPKAVEIAVPTNLVGLIIGSKGAMISQIEKSTQTKIQSPSRGQPPVFKVTGTRKAVSEARRRIQQIVAVATPKPKQNSNSEKASSDDEVESVGKAAAATPNNNNKPKQQQPKPNFVEIPVSANIVDMIAGVEGANLAELEKATNAKIAPPIEGGPPVFKVSGAKNAIKMARLLIEGIAAAMAPAAAAAQASESESDSDAESCRSSTVDVSEKQPPVATKKEDNGTSEKTFSVFVRNIDFAATEQQLRGLFQQCGKIKWLRIMRNKTTGASLGNAIIEFADENAYSKALERDGKAFMGRKVKVAPKLAKGTSNNEKDGDEKPANGAQIKVKRPVVIDADNVCMSHGRGEFYSARGLEVAIQYFEKLGHKVLAVVPEEKIRCSPDAQQHRVEGQDILCRLEKAGNIVVVPRKKLADGSTVKPYADLLTVKYAFEEDGVIISNDNMIDVVEKNPQYKEVVESRRIMFTFAADKFMIIDDPNGRAGVGAVDLLFYEKPSSEFDLISFD